jgi:cell wall-associated NlpC family hydrolase
VKWTAFIAVALLAGCASTPPASNEEAVWDRAAVYAVKLIGTPYRFGGTTPATGFDCSGLVQFTYRQAGFSAPRNTDEQRFASEPVGRDALRAGDLIFFDHEGKKNSHVGIYLGDGTFVHAPSTGKAVRRDRLDSPYWKKHVSETRRFFM